MNYIILMNLTMPVADLCLYPRDVANYFLTVHFYTLCVWVYKKMVWGWSLVFPLVVTMMLLLVLLF